MATQRKRATAKREEAKTVAYSQPWNINSKRNIINIIFLISYNIKINIQLRLI